MDKARAIAIADRAAPAALKVMAAVNLLFLASFLAVLVAAAELAQR